MASPFLHWWGQQLRDCLPQVLRRLWHGRQPTLTMRIAAGQLQIVPSDGAATIDVPLAAIENSTIPAGVADFLANAPTPERVDLTLAPDQFLVRDLALPHAARPHLAETIGYQLGQVSPFSQEDAYFACGVHEDGDRDAPLQAWFVAIPRAPINAVMDLLDQTPPTNPVRVTHPPEPGQPITVVLPLRRADSPQPQRLRYAWIGLAVAWLVAGGLHVYQRFDERAQLQALLQDLRAESAEVVALRDRLDQATAQVDWLNNEKRNSPSSLAMLNELTDLLDDNTWLQRLDFDGENLTLAGNAATPAAVIEALEGSPTFDRVRFESLSRDERTASDRFRIRAQLESPQSGPQSDPVSGAPL